MVQPILVALASVGTATALALQAEHEHGGRASNVPVMTSIARIPESMLPHDILAYYNDTAAQELRKALVEGAKPGAQPKQKFDYVRCHRSDKHEDAKACLDSGKESVFEAAVVSFPVPKEHLFNCDEKFSLRLAHAGGGGDGEKCVVYGVGLDSNVGFEELMASSGCEVHGFDCTVPRDSFSDKAFHFHPWCIGKDAHPNYSHSVYTDGNNMEFKTLTETMAGLNHTSIDLLKLDIEGFEYGVFENEILNSTAKMPLQISFELHTEEACNRYVPEEMTKGKGYNAVNQLFLKLFDKGYRVISKVVNPKDKACADFVVVNIEQLRRMAA